MKNMQQLTIAIGLIVMCDATMPRAGAQSGPAPAAATISQVPASLPDLESSRNAPRLEPVLPGSSGLPGEPRQSLNVPRSALEANKALVPGAVPANAAAQALRNQLQANLGTGVDANALRQLLLKNPQAPEVRQMMDSVRTASRPLLEAARVRASGVMAAKGAANAGAPPVDFDQVIPRKIHLHPLPAPGPQTNTVACEKCRQMDELRAKIADPAADPAQRDQWQLELAAYEVGRDNWGAAKAILDGLQATSSNAGLQTAVRRNLLVVDKKLAALAAPDQAQRERLELELATLHYDLGHEQAARRLTRALAQSAQTAQVRQDAAQLLTAEPKATQPVMPAGFAPSGQTQPNTTK